MVQGRKINQTWKRCCVCGSDPTKLVSYPIQCAVRASDIVIDVQKDMNYLTYHFSETLMTQW